LLLIVGCSWSGATLGSTTSVLGVLGPVIQGLGSLCSVPGSACVGDARMAHLCLPAVSAVSSAPQLQQRPCLHRQWMHSGGHGADTPSFPHLDPVE
jgi:hypothetical protein